MSKNRRPFLFKLFSFILFSMAVMGGLRFFQSIYQWQYLLDYQVKPGPLYSLISGLLIAVIMSIGMVGFWLRKVWSKTYLHISIAIISIAWWLDYLLFTKNSAAFSNWPFRLLATTIVVGFLYGYLQISTQKNRLGIKDEK
ncbi:MAG: hypothetical protein ACYDH1_13405 [Anaerolineaceae bacterium]